MFGRPISNRYKYYWYTVFTQLRFTRIINIIFVVQFLKFNFSTIRTFAVGIFVIAVCIGIAEWCFRRSFSKKSGYYLGLGFTDNFAYGHDIGQFGRSQFYVYDLVRCFFIGRRG